MFNDMGPGGGGRTGRVDLRPAGETATVDVALAPAADTIAADGVVSAIDRIWPAAADRFRKRVAAIEDYVAEVTCGNANSADVAGAREAAHKLAGTLGLFGLTSGSVQARELVELLDDHPRYDPEGVERLARLTSAIRSHIERRSRELRADSSPSFVDEPGLHRQ